MSVKIFFCYAREDKYFLDKLKLHLAPLSRQSLIDVWHDHDISVGTEWEREISRHLEEAEIVLLMVSPDFIASDYCYSVEMKKAMQRHERGEACVVPIILRPVYLREVPFMKLQALPSEGKPITSWPNVDEAYLDIVSGIGRRVEEWLVRQSKGVATLDTEVQVTFSNLSNSELLEESDPRKAYKQKMPDEGKTINAFLPRIRESNLAPDLLVALEALNNHDDNLLCAILSSKARAWIESSNADAALRLLRVIRTQYPQTHFMHLWSHYNLSLASLFRGDPVSPEWFSPILEECAEKVGLGILFRAERMEFNRRVSNIDVALSIANTLISNLPLTEAPLDDNVRRYAMAATYFLIAGILREGGLYHMAWEYINRAQGMYRQGIPSHDTELAHCYYAKAVCVIMTGIANVDAPFDSMGESNEKKFANALITLSYSYAAWFMDEISRARYFALEAAKIFSVIEYTKYASRARDLAFLLECWDRLDTSKNLPDNLPNTRLAKLVSILVGIDDDLAWLQQVFPTLRPSQALSLLQFAKRFGSNYVSNIQILLPRTLMFDEVQLRWHPQQFAASLDEADQLLRQHLKIAPDRRLPLLADAK